MEIFQLLFQSISLRPSLELRLTFEIYCSKSLDYSRTNPWRDQRIRARQPGGHRHRLLRSFKSTSEAIKGIDSGAHQRSRTSNLLSLTTDSVSCEQRRVEKSHVAKKYNASKHGNLNPNSSAKPQETDVIYRLLRLIYIKLLCIFYVSIKSREL